MSELRYPFENTPKGAEVITVADGLLWARMPLPMSLDHINVYLLEADDGWWIVDTGMKTLDGADRWEAIFSEALNGKPVVGVVCTHMHPDHLGMAGWLCDRWKAPLYMSYSEFFHAQTFSRLDEEDQTWQRREFYQRHAMGDSWIDEQLTGKPGFGKAVWRIPMSFRRMQEGDTLYIGKRAWQIMVGRGHSPEHVCLYSASDKLLISGDQVLPQISSNISVHNTEPEANPLAQWLKSLRRFSSLPSETLVLPSHGKVFYGLKERLHALISDHEDDLKMLEEKCCTESLTSRELMLLQFPRKLRGYHIGLALGETVAHLNYLTHSGKVVRELVDNVYRYRKATVSDVAKSQFGLIDASALSH
jgi:glyoxylase-like metal-dependent hydrolase (beta-lactamase superfamily II)